MRLRTAPSVSGRAKRNHTHQQVTRHIIPASVGVWVIAVALQMVRPYLRLRNVQQGRPCLGSLADVVDHDSHLDDFVFISY